MLTKAGNDEAQIRTYNRERNIVRWNVVRAGPQMKQISKIIGFTDPCVISIYTPIVWQNRIWSTRNRETGANGPALWITLPNATAVF